jgi:hypothetical protein
MSDSSRFWIGVNLIGAVTLMVIVALSTNYWTDHNKKIVELIGQGVDPVAAMCAMQDDYGENPVCLVLAAKAD